jgi:hypothetical protein
MAVFFLESLVLCGVAVRQDGLAVNARLGTSYAAGDKTPEIPLSMRHPSPGCPQGFLQPSGRLDQRDFDLVADADAGTGRSLRSRAGVPSRSPVSHTGRAALGWPTTEGGPMPTAAMRSSLPLAECLATVSEVTSGRLSAFAFRPSALRRDAKPPVRQILKRSPAELAWCKPASRTTPPASTRGT